MSSRSAPSDGRAALIAATSLFAIVTIGVLVSRLGALAFVATGVPTEVARFQARSALTGVGFTTSESESLVSHPVRRRILMLLMLAGNAGLITVVGSIILSFTRAADTADAMGRLVIMIAGATLILWLAHRPRLEAMLTSLLTRALNTFSDLELRDYHHLMRLSSDYAVTELAVQVDDWLAGNDLASLDLPDEGVIVLAIQRDSGQFVGAPRGESVLEPGDTVFLYGQSEVLAALDQRPATEEGQAEHIRAVKKQRARRWRQRMSTRPTRRSPVEHPSAEDRE